MQAPDWSGSSGDVWSQRWRETDRGLAEVGRALDEAIAASAPAGPFRALDVGCGPGTTTLALAARRPDAQILACDLSPALVAVARQRGEGVASARFITMDAEKAAREHGPFELIFSRHGVMFFDDPQRAFRTFREAASAAGRLVFSCFQAWEANPWAAELAEAAAGRNLPPPGREPSGFAFADPDYVRNILQTAGWSDADARALAFEYVAGEGPDAAELALSFFAEIGPAARILEALDGDAREAALERMQDVIGRHERAGQVVFPGAAWIWTAAAG